MKLLMNFLSILLKNDEIDDQLEGSRFNIKILSSLSSRCEKLNVPRGSSFIGSPNWSRYKNGKINPENIDDRCFQYTLALTQHYEEMKSYHGRVGNIKLFINQ